MARVRLHHDRAAGGQRRRGVASAHAEGEREVAGGEHQHRPERHQHAAQVRPREPAWRRASAVSISTSSSEPSCRTSANIRSWPLLRATSPRSRASGRRRLLHRDRDQLIRGGIQRIGDRADPAGPLRRLRGGQRRSGSGSGSEDLVELGGCRVRLIGSPPARGGRFRRRGTRTIPCRRPRCSSACRPRRSRSSTTSPARRAKSSSGTMPVPVASTTPSGNSFGTNSTSTSSVSGRTSFSVDVVPANTSTPSRRMDRRW